MLGIAQKFFSIAMFFLFFAGCLPNDGQRGAEAATGNGFERHGRLSVLGTELIGQNGEAVQLRGMSSHGLTWFPLYVNARSMESLRKRGANLFRAAMYVHGENGGYNENRQARQFNTAMLQLAVENALASDMYVIADWHLLEDQNPLYRLGEAMEFFDLLSARYANEPGVIYEICNEPNGETTWQDVKKYAEAVIPVIRKNSPKAVVIVGTPKHSSDLSGPMGDPLKFKNVMYAYHYYTGFADHAFYAQLDTARVAGLPVFVSEWGISREKTSGVLDIAEAYDFIDYSKKNRLSWANWSLSNEPSDWAAIRADSEKISGWTDDDLTESGKVIFGAFAD
jgi:aryl-phospho-beta-D-glucosidase BglC (GH1 family)